MTALAPALLLALSLGQTEGAGDDLGLKKHQSPPPVNVFEQRTFSANVGKGHYTLSTGGGMNVGFSGAGFSSFNFNAGAGGGYFLSDNLLLGASLGFGVSVFGSSVSIGLPIGLSGDFYAPIQRNAFFFGGMRVGLQPSFGNNFSFGIDLGLRAGLSFFLTEWFAIEPAAYVDINPNGPFFDVGMRWGVRWFF